jgi:hypothetical protein
MLRYLKGEIIMYEMPDEIKSFFDAMEDALGVEGRIEAHENSEFLHDILENECNNALGATLISMMLTLDAGPQALEAGLASMFYGGIDSYRHWLVDKGIDVLKLEGRE